MGDLALAFLFAGRHTHEDERHIHGDLPLGVDLEELDMDRGALELVPEHRVDEDLGVLPADVQVHQRSPVGLPVEQLERPFIHLDVDRLGSPCRARYRG